MSRIGQSRSEVSICAFLAIVLAIHGIAGQACAGAPRYAGVWQDGSQQVAEEIQDWGQSDGRPSLGGRLLFDAQNPVRTVWDMSLDWGGVPESFVEFQGGDRLPGRVVQFIDADPARGVPSHLVVEPAIDLGLPQAFSRHRVRVLAEWVRRLVAQTHAGDRIPSKSVRYASGEVESFRSLRWRSDGIQLLTESGVKRVPLADVSAADIGPWRSWEAWHRQLAVLNPGLSSQMLRMELNDGTRLTVSLECLKPRSLGGDNPERWFQLVQPAWALDLLAVPHRRVLMRSLFSPNETPLSVVEPHDSRHHGIISQAFSVAEIDASVRGESLRAAGREFAWGFGVQAQHELEFDLAGSAQRLRVRMGLDPWVGQGGCARGRVLLGDRTLFESQPLVGSESLIDSGTLKLHREQRRLTLVADALADERPAGADPLDIRDLFNWLEPLVEHDARELQREIEPYYLSSRPDWSGWTADPVAAGNWRPANQFDDSDILTPRFHGVLSLSGPLTLTRTLTVNRQRTTGVMRFGSPRDQAGPAEIEVSVDGHRVHRGELPGSGGSTQPLEIKLPLGSFGSKPIEIALRLNPLGKPAVVDWRGLSLIEDTAEK